MKTAAAAVTNSRSLRVLLVAPEETRRTQLAELLADAGHEIVLDPADADVVLADGDAIPEQIDAALRAVSAGLAVRTAPPPEAASEAGFGAMKEPALGALLTPREIEIVDAMSQGLTNKMIARRLEISLHTVKFHVESVLRKLGARTRAEAVARALEHRRRDRDEL
jgi:DNA-binding NarL/FixJ family response regulator